jgi:hypothetical protein
MAGIFQQIEMVWGGTPVTIPAERVLGAIAELEQVITFVELAQMLGSARPSMARLAQATGAVLRYAGVKVSDDDAYAQIFGTDAGREEAVKAMQILMTMCIPPDAMKTAEGDQGNAPRGRSGSSKAGTRRRSRKA